MRKALLLGICIVLFVSLAMGVSVATEDKTTKIEDQTITLCNYSIYSALVKIEDRLGSNLTWTPVNPQQEELLERFVESRKDLGLFSEKEIESIASDKASEINEFLRKREFTIQLQPFAPDEFGVAAVLDLLVEWEEKAERTTIEHKGEKYPAVKMDDFYECFQVPSNSGPIVEIATKSGRDWVHLMIPNSPPQNTEEMIKAIVAYYQDRRNWDYERKSYESVTFPMIDLMVTEDISWMKGMTTVSDKGKSYYIAQALHQNILKLNDEGARAKSAAAFSVRGGPPTHLVINSPFIIWFTREDVAGIIFAAYVTPQFWKDPGEL